MDVYYSAAYVSSDHAFDTTRKAQWVAESLERNPLPGVALREPRPLSEEQLARVHDAAYVSAVRDGEPAAYSSGLPWSPGVWSAATAANGGVVEALRSAVACGGASGTLSSGLHHARASRGAAFCTFNGLAVAASYHPEGVLIIDLDAHMGGGTWSLVRSMPWAYQLDIATARVDDYAPEAQATLDFIRDAERYLPTLESRLGACERLVEEGRVTAVLYNAGMDCHEDCKVGGLAGITDEVIRLREGRVFSWAERMGLPIAFTLAGGYTGGRMTQEKLVHLHRMTVEHASQRRPAA